MRRLSKNHVSALGTRNRCSNTSKNLNWIPPHFPLSLVVVFFSSDVLLIGWILHYPPPLDLVIFFSPDVLSIGWTLHYPPPLNLVIFVPPDVLLIGGSSIILLHQIRIILLFSTIVLLIGWLQDLPSSDHLDHPFSPHRTFPTPPALTTMNGCIRRPKCPWQGRIILFIFRMSC
jgi:hypothetical protein